MIPWLKQKDIPFQTRSFVYFCNKKNLKAILIWFLITLGNVSKIEWNHDCRWYKLLVCLFLFWHYVRQCLLVAYVPTLYPKNKHIFFHVMICDNLLNGCFFLFQIKKLVSTVFFDILLWFWKCFIIPRKGSWVKIKAYSYYDNFIFHDCNNACL